MLPRWWPRRRATSRVECRVVERHQTVGQRGAFGPDDGGEVGSSLGAGHGKLGKGPGGKEVFECGAVVRVFVGDGADHAALVVGGAGDADAGLVTQRRVPALGGDDEAGGERRVAFDVDGGVARRALDGAVGRGEQGHAARGVEPGVQRHAQRPGLDHPAEGAGLGVLVVEMEMQRRGRSAEAAVGDADVQDGAGRLRQGVPQTGVLEQPAGPGGGRHRRGRRNPGAPWGAAARGRSPPPGRRPGRGGRRGCRRPGRRRRCRCRSPGC